jgi:hypothetical protein
MYSPSLKTWLSAEPNGAAYVDGPNLYTFEQNNPINRLDPTGEFTLHFDGRFTAAEQAKITDAINNPVKERLRYLYWETKNEIKRWEDKKACGGTMTGVIKELQNMLHVVTSLAANIDDKRDLYITHEKHSDPDVQFRQITALTGTIYIKFNDLGKPGWAAMDPLSFQACMLHELTHIYGTEDNNSKSLSE